MDKQAEARLIKTQIVIAMAMLIFFILYFFWGEIRGEFFELWLDITESLKGYFIFMRKILLPVVGLYLVVIVFLKTIRVVHALVLHMKHKKDKDDSFWKYL